MNNLSAETIQKINRNLIGALRIVVISYGIDFLLLSGLVYAGKVSGAIVVAYGTVALIQNILVYLIVKSGLNRSLEDPGMTVSQIIFGTTVQTVFIILAPEIGIFFLVNFFNCFLFGVLALSTRQFFHVWAFGAIATAVAFFFVGERIGFPNSSGLTQAIMWTCFLLALGKSIYLASAVSTLRLKVSEKNRALTVALKQMEEMATHDALTGVMNRRAMLVAMDAELQKFKRKKSPFCIAVMDLDHFKHINDTFGHAVGDEVLKAFAEILQQSLRVTDRISRYGGDEFVVLLTDTPRDVAVTVLERICTRIGQHDWNALVPKAAVTVSIGVAEIANGDTVTHTFERADSALYEAKQTGRNAVHAALDMVAA